jgi:hypothetical protein
VKAFRREYKKITSQTFSAVRDKLVAQRDRIEHFKRVSGLFGFFQKICKRKSKFEKETSIYTYISSSLVR